MSFAALMMSFSAFAFLPKTNIKSGHIVYKLSRFTNFDPFFRFQTLSCKLSRFLIETILTLSIFNRGIS